jgi:hypothetical protein
VRAPPCPVAGAGVRRDAVILVAALLLAVALAFVGFEALRWEQRLENDDARFEASELAKDLWSGDEALPFAPTRRLLGIDDDLRYRRAVSLYTRSRPGEPTALNPERESLRGTAQRELTAISREDANTARRSQAAMLVALLALGRGDLFQSAEERLTVQRSATGNLQVAVMLDPDNAEAKRNLELVLTSIGEPPSGATDPGGTSDTGNQGGVGRSGGGY